MSATRSRVSVCATLAMACIVLTGCAAGAADSGDVGSEPMRFSDLAKTDIDQVIDLHVKELRHLLRELMLKLYRRNPAEWKRSGGPSAEYVVDRVFGPQRVPDFPELGGARDIAAVRLAFDENFRGDRVLAFIAGLATMVDKAYGNKRDFYMLDRLDAQKLYNCARNFEVAAWLLRSRRNAQGQPMLVSYSAADAEPNLSFERIIGKLIALQDMAARIIAGKTNRTIRKVVHTMARAVFLPI